MAQAKYHITRSGDGIAICRAHQGACPLGGEHFSTPEEAFKRVEENLASENGSGLSGIRKDSLNQQQATHHTSVTAADLVKLGADGKKVRDALRAENPSWGDRQVHTVYKSMLNNQPKVSKAGESLSQSTPTTDQRAELHSQYQLRDLQLDDARQELSQLRLQMTAENIQTGAQEGRAYFYGPQGKQQGVNPAGTTHFTPSVGQKKRLADASAKVSSALERREQAQTAIEEAGLGHTLSDEGSVLRVRTQAQKWLVENQLKGQISDGMWENTQPHDHWQAWADAHVVVDPQNVGRNFFARKDNYQLNSKQLLGIVGDEMMEDVAHKTNQPYNAAQMAADLTDLRKIFKTSRPRLG